MNAFSFLVYTFVGIVLITAAALLKMFVLSNLYRGIRVLSKSDNVFIWE